MNIRTTQIDEGRGCYRANQKSIKSIKKLMLSFFPFTILIGPLTNQKGGQGHRYLFLALVNMYMYMFM